MPSHQSHHEFHGLGLFDCLKQPRNRHPGSTRHPSSNHLLLPDFRPVFLFIFDPERRYLNNFSAFHGLSDRFQPTFKHFGNFLFWRLPSNKSFYMVSLMSPSIMILFESQSESRKIEPYFSGNAGINDISPRFSFFSQ
jgi:hypothetical protein